MEKNISIDGVDYKVTDDERINREDEIIFEIRERRDSETKFVVGMWDDLLGSPIQKVWKILHTKLDHDEFYEIGGSE
jgi:C4-type Zn-finger protein